MALYCVQGRIGLLTRYASCVFPHKGPNTTALLSPALKPKVPSIRNASGFASLVSRPAQNLSLPATTQPQTISGYLRPAQSLSILNRVTHLLPCILHQPARSLTYFGLRKGKRKTVRAVTQRFMRLHCGLWIRRRAGYKKRLWKKKAAKKKRLREIVFCNKTQCKLLDKMTSPFWKRRNWYINDPYQKYHDRTNLRV
ncbi:39S ribosomal protein L35, mitochondrial [Bombina bombina]|uniref:39S ribosomal protein L35, mitochondrial n=1 Tax=Bombina bombina TaxID=8345 RepID=UPI00235ADF19|nr:39S ribosomal protein L35, mitochondrial [Bombina bombina]